MIYTLLYIALGVIVIYAALNGLSAYLCSRGLKKLCHLGNVSAKIGAFLGILYLVYVLVPYIPGNPMVQSATYKVVKFSAIMLISWYVVFLTELAIREYLEKKHVEILATGITINIMKIALLSLGLLIALQSIGIEITPIITTLGVGGIAVALAVQDILSNLFGGLVIVMSKQTRVGDFIKLDEETQGFVEDINLRNTVIRRPFDGAKVIIPNSKIVNSSVVNFQKGDDGSYGVFVPVGVSYDSDLKKVRDITLKVAREVVENVEDADKSFEPIMRFEEFGDNSINFKVLFKSKTLLGRFAIVDTFIEKLKEAYDKEGIEIPFPQHDIHIRDVLGKTGIDNKGEDIGGNQEG